MSLSMHWSTLQAVISSLQHRVQSSVTVAWNIIYQKKKKRGHDVGSKFKRCMWTAWTSNAFLKMLHLGNQIIMPYKPWFGRFVQTTCTPFSFCEDHTCSAVVAACKHLTFSHLLVHVRATGKRSLGCSTVFHFTKCQQAHFHICNKMTGSMQFHFHLGASLFCYKFYFLPHML